MQKKIRRILSAVLVLAMVLSILPTFNLSVKASAATPANKTAVYDYVADISQYREKLKTHTTNNDASLSISAVYDDYPAKEGYVFAGWYTDVVTLTPLAKNVTKGGAYAKFVPEELMKAVAQVSTATDYATVSSSLRFVAAVDNLDYAQVGFLLNKAGSSKTYTHAVNYVHTSLSGVVEGGSLKPGYFHSSANYMFALTLGGIKDQGAGYTATPYWITLDGTKVDHIPTNQKTVEMGVEANIAAGMTEVNPDTAWFKNTSDVLYINNAQELLSFAEMSKYISFKGKTIKLNADIIYNESTIDTQAWLAQKSDKSWYVKDGVETWPGIGSASVPFAGTFDGQGHSIQGLVMLDAGKIGFMVQTDSATVKNVRVEKSIFRNTLGTTAADHCTGALIAYAKNTDISNVYSDAYLAFGYSVGLIGYAQGTINISKSWFDGTLDANKGNIRVGGFVGYCNSASTTINLTNCLFTGRGADTFGLNAYFGGFVGYTNATNTVNLTNCLSAGNLNAATIKGKKVGSVMGNTPTRGGGTYTNVYATNECYINSSGVSVAIGEGTTYTGTPVLVAQADLVGSNALQILESLSFADGTWVTVSDGAPELGAFNDTLNTGWYDAQASEYTIKTMAEWNGFVYLSQSMDFSGKTIKLGADLVFNTGSSADWMTTAPANRWSYIGSADMPFAGTLDGQGHTISGVYVRNETGNVSAGMFPVVNKATIKNLTIANSVAMSTAGSGNLGILVGLANGVTIENVTISNDVIISGSTYCGTVGYVSAAGSITFRNVWMDGVVTNGMWTARVGSLLGATANVAAVVTVENCLFTGEITLTHTTSTAENYVGGFVGGFGADGKVTIKNSLSAGTITLGNPSNAKNYVGSLVGIGSWRGKAYTTFTNAYATKDCYTVVTYRDASSYTGTPVLVDRSAIIGDAAATTLSALDFAAVWSVQDGALPKLGNDHVDISWYNPDKTEYVLMDAKDLLGFSCLADTTNFSGKTIKLGADIVLNEGDAKTWATKAPANIWEPIGKNDASLAFDGTFDGQGHTISGLYYTSASYSGGLFAYTGSQAVIKNLKLTNSYIKSTHGAEWSATGSIAAFVNGTDFINVYSDAIIDTNSGYTGGIGGRVQGNAIKMENCEFAGTVTATGSVANYIGGLMGGFNVNTAGASSIKNCKVTGTVTAANIYVGGIIGIAQGPASSSVTITDCEVTGAVTGTVGISGGFIGRVGSTNVTISGSTFSGTVNGGTKLGGFVGQTNTAGYTTTIKDSTFTGTVTATNTSESVVAGFVAHVNNGNVTVQNVIAEGTLVAPGAYAAGVVASIANTSGITVNVDGAVVTTDVQCASSNAGGIVGRILGTNPSCTISNSFANATFSANTWCTAQVIAHAQGNAAKLSNVTYCVPAGSYAYGGACESESGNVTGTTVKLVNDQEIKVAYELYKAGMRPDFGGFLTDYVIRDAEDYYGFMLASFTQNFSGKTIKLAADITLNAGSAADWAFNAPSYNAAPIGGAATFAGTFDGQGYTIFGLYVAHANGNGMGMFREVTGTVKNFKLKNAYLANVVESNYGYNGTIAACLNGGTITRVYTDAYINTVDSYAGGIAGYTAGTSATISECQFDGVLRARCSLNDGCNNSVASTREHAKYVGGLVGAGTATNTTITNCASSGKIINECVHNHRTGGLMGGIPNSGKNVTITSCLSVGEFATINHSNNSYHYNMIMDCRGELVSGKELITRPTNMATLYNDNYVLNQQLFNGTNTAINSGSSITGASEGNVSTVRYTEAEMLAHILANMDTAASVLDFNNTWNYKQSTLPMLRCFDTERAVIPYYLTVGTDKILCLQMTGEQYDDYKDAKLKETLLEGQTNDSGWQLYALAYEYYDAVAFKDIDYCENAYITKYVSTTLEDYNWYVQEMKNYGFNVVTSNVVNTDDAYYTALTYNRHSYSVTYFANTGETYVTVSNEMKFSPYMIDGYYKDAEKNDPAKTTYSDITVTMVELSDGGLCQIIRLKNGHYIVIDGGSGTTAAGTTVNGTTYTDATRDRAELAAALGATADAYNSGDKNNPQIIVDAWIFTHDHADHIGWLRGGVYGAMQVDVYVKGFYYNFTDDFRVDAEFEIGGTKVQGYGNIAYAYEDSKGVNGTNRYNKGSLDNGAFWVEYTATHKMANNVNTPSWGKSGIPIYRLQAGQKYYFNGVTMEVAYTQDQIQPSEYKMDINASCAWLLFTDDHGNTYLEAGDTEIQNQDAVIKLYDDYYDGGSGPNYALFGADLVNAFHHGLNTEINANDNYTRLNTIFGIQNTSGNAATANTATNANDGRTKFIFYTRGYLNSIFGYVSNESSWNSRNMRANHYLTGYVYPKLITSSLNAAKNYPNLKSPIAFASYCTKADDKGVSWQGTTVVSFSASGISWNKQQTSSIYK